VAVPKLHRWTVAACFVFSRKIGRTDFGTFETLSPTGDIASETC
jgi:hypothetical protein